MTEEEEQDRDRPILGVRMLSCGQVNLARDEAVCVPARLGTKPQTVSQPQTDFIPFNTKQQTGNT